jgi:signal transduction histidine kinase
LLSYDPGLPIVSANPENSANRQFCALSICSPHERAFFALMGAVLDAHKGMTHRIGSGKESRPADSAKTTSLELLPGSDTRRPRIERRRPERRALFLADISRQLAESLDYEKTLSTVARLAMPELGAWCIVDLFDESGAIRRVGVIHPEPQLQALARELETHYPPAPGDPLGAPRMLDTQQPELVAEVSDEMLVRSARDKRHLEILRGLRLCSYMVVPLRARGRLLGALTFVSADDEVRYTPRDLLFAEDLASRAATAMDNARLYQEAEQARKDALDALARAAEANRAKADFLAVMSHELHTPLNAIAGYAELLELGMRGPVTPQQREAIARIRLAQRQLLSLVNDILTFARTETGQLEMRIEPVDVAEAVESVRFLVEPLTRATTVDINIEPCNPPLRVLADRERMHHILVNLLSNAVKFSPPGSPIKIVCGRAGSFVAIRVIDSGSGIAPEKLDLIFEPFVQASAGFTRTIGGSGLGLAISRDLARLMNGDVSVESVPGMGSVFTLTLPMVSVSPHLP